MSDWYHSLVKLASSVDERVDYAKFQFKLRRGWLKPIEIQTYRGHGTEKALYLKGRVLEHRDISGSSESDSVWENILSMYRRFASREIPGARLLVRFGDQEQEAKTDNEGYFDLVVEPREPLRLEKVWHEIEVILQAPLVEGQEQVRAVGHALVAPPKSEFGIISDIDDTIVRTGATDPLTMARIVVLNNPHTRLPFEGVAAFYQALRKGPDGEGYNPLFYVSSSPWNLYDLLVDFMNINGIPLGPIFLRDVGLEQDHLIKTGHHEHKLKQIRTILDTHTDLPFIMVGDSGQEDPEIYREVVRDYPGRIKVIYIRDVTLEERANSIRLLIKELQQSSVEMVLAADTVAAATHAAQKGFIQPEALPGIQAKKAQDEQAPTIAEQIPGVDQLPGVGSNTEAVGGDDQDAGTR